MQQPEIRPSSSSSSEAQSKRPQKNAHSESFGQDSESYKVSSAPALRQNDITGPGNQSLSPMMCQVPLETPEAARLSLPLTKAYCCECYLLLI